jgi:uncharacterized membrane protein YhiD involved in acid resistance
MHSSTGEVRGHTTAASLWAMSAIGMSVGSGHELLGVLLALVLNSIITISEWQLLTRLAQIRTQKQSEAALSRSYQLPLRKCILVFAQMFLVW